jgi:hypothetical protein
MQEFLNQVSGENHSLGLFGGTLVLISLIILTLFISRQKKTEQENSNHDEKIMLGLFLFFIKGGFGAICALAFYELTSYPSPIRVWSRLSPWLLFYALTIIFQKISFRRKATNNIWLLTLTIMLIATSLSRIPQDYWSIEKKSFVSRNLEVQEMSRQGVQKCVVLQLPIDTLPPTSAPSNIASNSDDYYYSGLQGLLVANSFVWSEGSYPGSLSYTKFIHQIYEKNRLQLSLQGLKAGNVCAIEVDSLKSKYLNLPAIPLEYKKVWSDSRYSLFMESQK